MEKQWKQWQTFIILGSKITADGDYSHALVAQMVKCLPTMQETQVQSLGLEDPLEKEMTIHSSILAWKIPWTEEPGRLQSMDSQRVRYDWATSLSFFLLLKGKAMTNIDSLLKSRGITLPTKVHLVKGMVLSSSHVWMWELDYKESWSQRTDSFELWCWRRLWRVPWTARRSNQSILKEISPEYSFEAVMLKLKLQYFGSWWEEWNHWKRSWCWEIL